MRFVIVDTAKMLFYNSKKEMVRWRRLLDVRVMKLYAIKLFKFFKRVKNVPNVPYHHWAGGAALATTIAHKGSVAGAKTLAGTVVDLLSNPALVKRAKETFAEEIGDIVYKPLIPEDQKPPVNLNREMMESFRKPMSEHYVKEKPVFV